MTGDGISPKGQSGEREGSGSRVTLEPVAPGVWRAPGARIIDHSGRKRLAIGYDGFIPAMNTGVLVDKTMLIADVLDSGYAATLFCRPRRFGKTLNMTMLKAFLEAPEAGGLSHDKAEEAFTGTEVWDSHGGDYRARQGTYPVVHISLNTVKKATWEESLAEIRNLVATEYLRHRYLRADGTPLPSEDIAYFDAVAADSPQLTSGRFAGSLSALCRMLRAYHSKEVVVLIDEYDAPVMAGYTYGYYDEVVNFLKGWLTGAIKDGGAALGFACLTGVQRISKESIFSDLNNLYVSTPLEDDFDERYGFTDAEVSALATYLGHPDCMPEARTWYDGYRFGRRDVYNPWSVVNYLNKNCTPGVYWGNTSSNSVVSELVASADNKMLNDVYSLLEPGGTVTTRLDVGVVFPDMGVRRGALWSMLYLAGYLTTDDVEEPASRRRRRALRIPNKEVAELYLDEVVDRFSAEAGSDDALVDLQDALIDGNAPAFERELAVIVRDHASSFDLTRESDAQNLLLGLLIGTQGYVCVSNREEGYGRYDIRLEPDPIMRFQRRWRARPLVTVELKFLKPDDAPKDPEERDARLRSLAEEAIGQIAGQGYDAALPAGAKGRLRWGVAFCGKRVAAVCERVV